MKKIKESKDQTKVKLYKISDEHDVLYYVPFDSPEIVKAIMLKRLEEEVKDEYDCGFSQTFDINSEVIEIEKDNLSKYDYNIVTDINNI